MAKTTETTVIEFKIKLKFFSVLFRREWKTSKPKRETGPRKK